MFSKSLQLIYLVLTLTGLVLVPFFLLRFLGTFGFDFGRMFSDFVRTKASTIIAVDLLIGSIVYHIFVIVEARRLGMKHYWAYILWFWIFAFCSSFPLFLLMRERKLEAARSLKIG
jgi:hypothetical protein